MITEKRVTILREIRRGDNRVILLPEQVPDFVEAGFRVFVEEQAGLGIGISDTDYKTAGAEIIRSEEAWTSSPFVIKYKAPLPEEFERFRPGMHLGAIFHAEGDPALVSALCRGGVTAYSYEFFKTQDGFFPIAVVGGEISGKLAVIYGAYYLQKHVGGRGILLASVPGTKPAKVLVIGYGNAGGAAARTAAALGAEVVVLGTNPARLRRFQATVPPNVKTYLNTSEILEREIVDADLVVGAILISTYDTPCMIDERLVRRMKPGSVIIDVTCGYGAGYLPTFDHFSSFEEPVYERFGVLHCKIDTMPAAVPTSTVSALSRHLTPYLVALGNSIYDQNSADPISAAGKIVENGEVVHREVQRNLELHQSLTRK